MVPGKYEIIEKSKYIIEAKILSSNFDRRELHDCGINKKDLRYKVKVLHSFGRILSPEEYELDYVFHCGRYPSDVFFETGKNYLLALEKLENKGLYLLSSTCEWWGWDISKKQEILNSVNIYCKKKDQEVKDLIEASRDCKTDSDCDYIAHSSAYDKSNVCHRFVNKNKISELRDKIKTLSSGPCLDAPVMLCKAPIKEFIKCKNKKCYFP